MTPDTQYTLLRRAATTAAILYVLSFFTVAGVSYGLVWPLVADVDPAQAARNILAHPTQFRLGVTGHLLYTVELVVLSAALYLVLRTIDPLLALLAALGRIFHAVVWVLISLNLFAALRVLTRPEFHALPAEQRPLLARIFLSGYDAYYVALLFWSLGSTVAAWAWLRSCYVPRALAIFGILASAWAALCSVCLYVDPNFPTIVHLALFDVPLVLFEFALSAVLLFRGPRAPVAGRPVAEA
jgi:hypothetical protein